MTEFVEVTSAQKAAAQAVVEWSAATGREVSSSVRKIANAKVLTVKGASVDASSDPNRSSR